MDYINNKKIGAVVVLYNPDSLQLNKALAILTEQVDALCVVDNSQNDNGKSLLKKDNIIYVPLYENKGIAAAQNVGMKILEQMKMDFIVFSDQDSMASDDTVERLVKSYLLLVDMGCKVGATGTRAINAETGKPYPSKSLEMSSISLQGADGETKATECSYIRSSISLIATSTIKEIGGFDESLFIDGVDNEWCWRAATKGYRSFIIENAAISHHLGDGDRVVGSRRLSISSSFRIYYQYRNYLWLCRRDYVPMWWKRKHLLKYMVKCLYYPLCVSPRLVFLKRIAKGVYDGLFKCRK